MFTLLSIVQLHLLFPQQTTLYQKETQLRLKIESNVQTVY